MLRPVTDYDREKAEEPEEPEELSDREEYRAAFAAVRAGEARAMNRER